MSDKKYPEVERDEWGLTELSQSVFDCCFVPKTVRESDHRPGVADDDGEAGRKKGEHEEKLFGGAAVLVQDDGAGPHREVQAELAPGGERGRHQEHEPEYPGGGNVERQPAGAVHPGKVITRLSSQYQRGFLAPETVCYVLCNELMTQDTHYT